MTLKGAEMISDEECLQIRYECDRVMKQMYALRHLGIIDRSRATRSI